MATKCVMFKRTAKKGGRKITPRKVCFKRKEATPAQKAAKVRRAKKTLREFACKASGAPAEACASRKLKR